MVKKAGDAKAKANLQPPFYIGEIDFRCPKGHYLLAKKEDTYWKPCNKAFKDKDKAKCQISFSANQPQTQASEKDKRSCRGGHGGYLATGVNATKIAKKDKNKAPKDLSYIECYTCHQKGHYVNKCQEKSKN